MRRAALVRFVLIASLLATGACTRIGTGTHSVVREVLVDDSAHGQGCDFAP